MMNLLIVSGFSPIGILKITKTFASVVGFDLISSNFPANGWMSDSEILWISVSVGSMDLINFLRLFLKICLYVSLSISYSVGDDEAILSYLIVLENLSVSVAFHRDDVVDDDDDAIM